MINNLGNGVTMFLEQHLQPEHHTRQNVGVNNVAKMSSKKTCPIF